MASTVTGKHNWALSNGLTQFHLAGSGRETLGGDLAYQYSAKGTLAGIGLGKAQEVLTSAQSAHRRRRCTRPPACRKG